MFDSRCYGPSVATGGVLSVMMSDMGKAMGSPLQLASLGRSLNCTANAHNHFQNHVVPVWPCDNRLACGDNLVFQFTSYSGGVSINTGSSHEIS